MASTYDWIENKLKTAFTKKLSDVEILMEARKRFGEQASEAIIPTYTSQRAVSLEEWQQSVDLATNPHTLNRYLYYKVAENAMLDLHLTSITETRILDLQASKFKLIDASGKEDPGAKEMFEDQWYLDFVKYAWESHMYGYSLVELWDLSTAASQVTLNKGKQNFFPMLETTLIPRAHVRPEEGKWLVNTFDPKGTGHDFTSAPVDLYYIGIGNKNNLGMLKKIIPAALAKRYAVGAWGEYVEKLGVPFRWVTMKGKDNKREQALAQVMKNMGPAGWGIFHEGESIQLLQTSGGDVHKCFMELGNFCDKQMSKAVVGSTMTVDAEGGQYKGDVHEATAEIRHLADKTFIKYLNNGKLIPRLTKRGYPLAGYKYDIDETKELSINDQIEVDKTLLTYYNIEPKYIADKYDIPEDMIKGKSPENVQDVLTETQKKKVQARGSKLIIGGFEGSLINSVDKLYSNSCCFHAPKSAMGDTYRGIESVIKNVFDGKIEKGDLDDGLYDWQLKTLMKAVQEGRGEDFVTINYDEQDEVMISTLKENVFVFSAFKNYQELRAMTDLLTDEDGNIRSFSDFKKDALELHSTYDKRFLRAEYDHALVSGQATSMWEQFQKEKDRFKLLTYDAILDGSTTPLCSSIDGTTRPVDDPFWDIYMIPNHWGERSTIRQASSGESTDLSQKELTEPKGMFKGNVGKSGVIYPDKHPYFQASKAQKDKVNKYAAKKFKPDDKE